MSKEIWVFAEQRNGKIAGVTAELLAKSLELAGPMGGYEVAAVLPGADNEKMAEELGKLGAEKVYSIEHARLADYRCDVYTEAIAKLVRDCEPEYFFFGATGIGSELAPSVAAEVKTGLAAHCIDLRYNGERLNCMVPAFGGKVVSEIYIPDARPVMASVRAGILDASEADVNAGADAAEVVKCDAAFLDGFDSAEEFLGFEQEEVTGNDIENAEIVISAGRGAATDVAWDSINKIADKLGGAVAYSRSFKDSGMVPDEKYMIGTSGKSVRPRVLLNAGVSGASQYVCGIGKSKTVISINKSANVPIFSHSDYGVVGDADKILPAVLERL